MNVHHPGRLLFLGAFLISLTLSVHGQQTAESCLKEGKQKQGAGDLEGALIDYDKVIALVQANTKKDDSALATLSVAQVQRETVLMAKGDYDTAWSAFLKEKADDDAANIGIGETHCYMWLIRVRKGRRKEADRELAASLSSAGSKIGNLENSVQIAKYLVNQCSESELIAFVQAGDEKAGSTQHQGEGEAWYFVGMKYLLAGDKAKAAEDFQKVLSLKGTMFNTRTLVRAELKAIAAKP
ncbi:MAG: hypothetical protein ABJF10_00930 [Chthoniobacter sp.]|uniref:hypothetical protein n=1 Tax=Chthoniobacter sp. TaxID=2510640 RepID=UPI0032ADFE32